MIFQFDEGVPQAFCAAKLIEWVTLSQDGESWPAMTPLTLPPLQRNGVWRPRQVLDLWRSVLEGLPIGLFYVQDVKPDSMVVDPQCRSELKRLTARGWNLIDGQQRARALALGAGDPFGEGRCVWVRFKDEGYELLLSSKAQPAGYRRDGSKHRVEDRRNWLEQHAASDGSTSGPDLKKAAWWEFARLPWGCSPEDTAKLADLLPWPGRQQVTGAVAAKIAASNTWQRDLKNLCTPGCVVFMLLPESIKDDARRTLDMFRRIGAGGTPLSQGEQLYAAYKIAKPELRHVVERIHEDVSAILTPGQIVEAAIRMAHTIAFPKTGWSPGFDSAIKALSAPEADDDGKWVHQLNTMLTPPTNGTALLARSFQAIRTLLSRCEAEDGGSFYLPGIAMAQLPAQVWQVFAFWWSCSQPADTESRRQVVRFALFWRLAIIRPEPAVQVCFRIIANGTPMTHFDDRKLYRALVDAGAAHAIAMPCQLDRFFRSGTDGWSKHEQRFPQGHPHRGIAEMWWFGTSMLPWLQRRYVDDMFVAHDPLSDHEDDLPYDVDHICARSLWQPDGRSVSYEARGFSSSAEWDAAMGQAWVLGEAVGNKRLVKFSQNRGDGAASLCSKMPFLSESPADYDKRKFGGPEDFCMNREAFACWRGVEAAHNAPVVWSAERRTSFLRAVEQRTAFLYETFYKQLAFADWCEGSTAPS